MKNRSVYVYFSNIPMHVGTQRVVRTIYVKYDSNLRKVRFYFKIIGNKVLNTTDESNVVRIHDVPESTNKYRI